MSQLPQLPQRLHHSAFVVRDHEANRQFFGLADGSALAFFQFADDEMYERSKAVYPQIGRFQHIALKVDRATYDEIDRRLAAADIARRQTDHGYCLSLYVTSPDGLRVEFTVDPEEVDEINAVRRADAHAERRRWLGGDHASNNLERAHS